MSLRTFAPVPAEGPDDSGSSVNRVEPIPFYPSENFRAG